MTNTEIIISEAISKNIFTEEQVNKYLEAGKMLPLHTYQAWMDIGYQVKKGEHAIIKTRLWKPKAGKSSEETEGDERREGFYLTNAYLFSGEQVEKVQNGGMGK